MDATDTKTIKVVDANEESSNNSEESKESFTDSIFFFNFKSLWLRAIIVIECFKVLSALRSNIKLG